MKSSGYSTLRGSDTSITSMNINTTSFCNFSCYSDLQTKVDSIPIAHRVRRKRQRVPPSLLIENASDRLQTLLGRSFLRGVSDQG
jgi:hypothetical protein